MIKNFIILILLLCIFVVLKKLNKEHFHEVSEMVNNNEENDNKQCEEYTYDNDSSIGCSKYKDFNPYPEKKPFILSRCLVNHTTSNNFKDDIVSGCPRHETLCESSGCKAAVNYYWKNLETLKSITDITFANRQEVDGQGSGRFSRRGQYSDSYSGSYSDSYDGLLSECSCNYEIDKTSNENNLYQEWLSKISE